MLRKLWFSIWPHRHKYGRGKDGIKTCKLCGHTKEVKRRVRKAIA